MALLFSFTKRHGLFSDQTSLLWLIAFFTMENYLKGLVPHLWRQFLKRDLLEVFQSLGQSISLMIIQNCSKIVVYQT
jgi:hypothetical protein